MTTRKFSHTRFTMTPNWIIDAVPPGERANAAIIWHVLWRHADNETREAWPSRETIGEEAGKSRATVGRTIALLESIGGIERTGQRHNKRGWGSQMYVMHFDPPRTRRVAHG